MEVGGGKRRTVAADRIPDGEKEVGHGLRAPRRAKKIGTVPEMVSTVFLAAESFAPLGSQLTA